MISSLYLQRIPSVSETLDRLGRQGDQCLTNAEAIKRVRQYGYNEIQTKEEIILQRIFRRFWRPIPWMIETAAVLSALVQKWEDFAIILFMLLVNDALDFFQEHHALMETLTGSVNSYRFMAKIKTTRPASDYTVRIFPTHQQTQIPLENRLILWEHH